MRKLALLILLLPQACAPKPVSFEQACRVLETIPPGTEIKDIERAFELPAPRKTLAESELYGYRIFQYVRADGLQIDLGLYEASPDKFLYIGHHHLFVGKMMWRRWQWTDGEFEEYRGPQDPFLNATASAGAPGSAVAQ